MTRIISIGLILLVAISCSARPAKKVKVKKTMVERKTDCVMSFISADVLPLEASSICVEIYKRQR